MIKKLSLFLLLCNFFFYAGAQINPWLGIYDIDFCNFETGFQGSRLSLDTSAQNLWQIGLPSKPFFDTAYSAPNAILTDSINPYAASNHSWFEIRFPMNYFGIIVGFKHKFQTDTLVDGGYIEVSYNDGVTWANVIHDTLMQHFEFNTENMYADSDTLAGGNFGFSGSTGNWIYTRIQWTWALRWPDSLTLRFHFISDSTQTNKAGWMIDDIRFSSADYGGAVDELKYNSVLNVYPNPFSQNAVITLRNEDSRQHELRIFDRFGRAVKYLENLHGNEIILAREDLPAGIYFFKVMSETESIGFGKFVVE